MPKPILLRDLPLGVIRSMFSTGRDVIVVDTRLFRDSRIERMAQQIPVAERIKRYWVLSIPGGLHDRVGQSYSVGANVAAVQGRGFDVLEDGTGNCAFGHYDSRKGEVGKVSVKRGYDGMKQIGKED